MRGAVAAALRDGSATRAAVAGAATAARLQVCRLNAAAWLEREAGAWPALGAIAFGADAPASADSIGARLLAPADGGFDAWCGGAGAPLRRGRCGNVRWRDDGHWLWGVIDLDDTSRSGDLAPLAERAYAELFATLDATARPHLLRIWNFLPQINADGGGLERYRQFNAGRQRAFVGAGRALFDGAPAASALGTHGGPLALRFVAGRSAAVAVENPRQVSAYHYPSDHGPRSPIFSRAAWVDAGAGRSALLISGTASIVGHRSLHAGDVAAQARETVANLRALVAAAARAGRPRVTLADLRCIVYLRHAADLTRVRAELNSAFGADAAALDAAQYVEADICRSELLVEIEAHAFGANDR